MQSNTYTLFLSSDRVKYVTEKLGDKAVVKGTDSESNTVEVDVTIETPLDLLMMFQAGYFAGYDHMQKVYEGFRKKKLAV